VPELADWCGVSIPTGDGLIQQVAVAHVDPDKVKFAWELSERYPVYADEPAGVAAVIRDGQTQVVTDVTDEMLAQSAKDQTHLELIRALGIRAGVIVPMTTPGGIIGALTLVTAESGRTFSPADVELAEEMARRAGAAVENARLYTERSHIALTLQRGLLPPKLPDMLGWSAATMYRPAGRENWVGGDFYDAFAIQDGWMVVVGDVVGHGPGAAALTAEARYTLRTAATLSGSALVALDQLNRGLWARDPGMALCTAACVTLRQDEHGGTLEVVCAGHPPPLLVRGDEVTECGHPGPMLGAWAERDWTTSTCRLEADEVLVLYTDGVVDAEGEGERFGETRLRRALAGSRDANDAVQRISGALGAFEVGEQADDTAVLAVSPAPVPASMRPEQASSSTS
jgi:serine phosphatase RsbU (regulator of sigma subunit)